MNLFFIIIIWGWRSRWSTRSSGCWSGWAAIVLVIFFPLFNKRAQNLQNNNLGSVSRLACFLDFSVSVKVCVKARVPVSFSSEKSTLFGGPLGPTRLLRRWGWRRRGRALVMSVWALCCPVYCYSKTCVPTTQHQAVCVYLHATSTQLFNNWQKWQALYCKVKYSPFHWVWTQWICFHHIPDWGQKDRED